MADNIATYIGYALFALSEILPLINVPTNGFLHTFIIGFSNAFKNKEKDIELAQVLVQKQGFADIINVVSTNPQIKAVIESLINNPQFSNTLQSLLNNNSLYLQIQKLINNNPLQNVLNLLIDDTYLVSILSDEVKLKELKNKHTLDIINNISLIPQTQKQDISNIISILRVHPERINDIIQILTK